MTVRYLTNEVTSNGRKKYRQKTFPSINELLDFVCYYSIRSWNFLK